MTSVTKIKAGTKLTPAQVRENYLRSRQTVPNALTPPNLHADNPTLPPTADDPNNQLPRQFQGQVLKVEVPSFEVAADPGRTGIVYLTWDGVRQRPDQYNFTTPIDPAVFPIELPLPAAATVNAGAHALGFAVSVGGNPVPSDPFPVFIDQQDPNHGNPGKLVILPPEVERDGITKEYLDANGKVTITVPDDYVERRIGDVIEVYFGRSTAGAVLVGTVTRADTTTPITVDLTAGQVGLEEGLKFIFYRLTDRIGNRGPESAYKQVRVVLTPAPGDLKPLTVPLADDGLIDIEDARVGVDVKIDAYTDATSEDRAQVEWDGQALPPAPVTPGSDTFVRVPYSALLNGNPGEKTVDVTYEIVRGDLTYPEPTVVTVNVDLRTPGPVNPDEPDPVNPDLDLVEVLGAVTTDPNKLTLEDAGQPATASVPLYGNSKADDVVQLYWNGVEVPDSGDPDVPGGTYVVTGSEAAGFVIDFEIPWAIIDAAGNSAALPVHYSIAHPSVNDAVVYSGDQPVEVDVKVVTLPNVTFLNLDPDFDLLNCQSLRNISPHGWVVEVAVAGGEPKLADQTLTFNYVGLKASATPVTYEFTFTPTLEQANNGFVAYLPYDPPLINTRDGDGSIEYTAIIDGIERTSAKHEVDVFMAVAGPGNPTCEITAPVLARRAKARAKARTKAR